MGLFRDHYRDPKPYYRAIIGIHSLNRVLGGLLPAVSKARSVLEPAVWHRPADHSEPLDCLLLVRDKSAGECQRQLGDPCAPF